MKLSVEQKSNIWNMHSKGMSGRRIAIQLGVSKSAVNNLISTLKKQGVKTNGARITFIDVENAPALVVAFNRYDVNLTQQHVINEGGWLISVAWSSNFEAVQGIVLTPEEAKRQDDFRIMSKLQHLIHNSDIIVAHNLKKFDWKMITARMIKNGLILTHKPKLVDTLEIARKNFKFPSNKLNDLAVYLGIEQLKEDSGGIETWVDCMHGKPTALNKMLKYNKQDIVVLLEVYARLSVWGLTPNANLYKEYLSELKTCVHCSSTNVLPTGNKVATPSRLWDAYLCHDCGKLQREAPKGKLIQISN